MILSESLALPNFRPCWASPEVREPAEADWKGVGDGLDIYRIMALIETVCIEVSSPVQYEISIVTVSIKALEP